MATAGTLSTVHTLLDEVVKDLKDKDDKRPDLQKVMKEFKAFQKVVSEPNFELKQQTFEDLCEVISKFWDYVTIIGERSYNESKENRTLTKRVITLEREIEKLEKDNEVQKSKMKDLEGDELTLILGQMVVEIEQKIIAKVIPADIISEFSIVNLRSLEDVLDWQTRLCKRAFNGRYDEHCKSITSWEKLQTDLQWDIRHDQFVLKVKQDRNITAHRFHLQRAKEVFANYRPESKQQQFIHMYEKLHTRGQQ